MRRALLSLAVLLLAAVPLGLRPSTAFAANCFGRAATVAPVAGVYTLTAGDDVVAGTSKADTVTTQGGGTGGTDYVCTGGGDDSVFMDGVVAATVQTGNGNDSVRLQNFSATGWADVSLGNGDDFGQLIRLLGTLNGGNGKDILFYQGSGIIPGAVVDGGPSNDQIQSASADFVYGGSGADEVIDQSASGATLVDCGSGRDAFIAPNAAEVDSCERDLF